MRLIVHLSVLRHKNGKMLCVCVLQFVHLPQIRQLSLNSLTKLFVFVFFQSQLRNPMYGTDRSQDFAYTIEGEIFFGVFKKIMFLTSNVLPLSVVCFYCTLIFMMLFFSNSILNLILFTYSSNKLFFRYRHKRCLTSNILSLQITLNCALFFTMNILVYWYVKYFNLLNLAFNYVLYTINLIY